MDYEVNHTHAGVIRGGLSLSTMGFITWLVFLILKVTGTWAIPWFWVFFPLWICPAIGLGLFLIVFVVALIIALVNN